MQAPWFDFSTGILFAAVLIVQASCAPTSAVVGSGTTEASSVARAVSKPYQRFFELSSRDMEVLSRWNARGSQGNDGGAVYSDDVKLAVAHRIYEQAMQKGFYQGPIPSTMKGFDWQCIYKPEPGLTHFHAYTAASGSEGCYTELFSAMVDGSLVYDPDSFVFDEKSAAGTTSCTQHIHYTIKRVPHGMRCPGVDDYQVKIYDARKCSQDDLANSLRPNAELLQLGTGCGGRVKFTEPSSLKN